MWMPTFEHIWGNGCTDGEFCTRIASEDLRQSITGENALDEAIFKTHVDKHRLKDWLEAAARAAKLSNHEERQERLQEVLGDAAPVAEAEETGLVAVRDNVAESVEVMEVVAEEKFERDGEESAAEREDVEMQDS
jgi:nuclear pore complex protein Nup133